MQPIRTLLDCSQFGDPALSLALRDFYGGDLSFPTLSTRPYVVANFVSTLDGVVSYKIPDHSSGSSISGSDQADRFIMGLLRASADAIMVGSRTVIDTSPNAIWTPASIYPQAGELYRRLRLDVLRKLENPLVVIVSGSGQLDLERAVFRAPDARTVILTTDAGKRVLANAGSTNLPSLEVRAIEAVGGSIHPKQILELLLGEFGVRLLLHEGGPATLGQFAAQGVVDELFLTLAPQVAGRLPATIRPGMIEGVEFGPGDAPWFNLLSIKNHADHLYLRYRMRHDREPAAL